MGSIHLMHPGEYMGVCSPQHQASKKLRRFHAASNQLKNGSCHIQKPQASSKYVVLPKRMPSFIGVHLLGHQSPKHRISQDHRFFTDDPSGEGFNCHGQF